MSFFDDSEANPLVNLFHTLASASAARAASASAAAVQVEHYKQLTAEGMDPIQALELTARTSEAIIGTVEKVVGHLAENAESIVNALEAIVSKTTIRQEPSS